MKAKHLIRLIDRARLDAGRGKHEAALAGFRGVLKEDPGNLYAKIWEAHQLRSLQRFADALASYEAVAEKLVAPEQETWRGIAHTLLELGEFDAVEARCVKHLRVWEHDVEVMKIRAQAAGRGGDLTRAAAIYAEALQLSPKHGRLWANAALTDRAAGRNAAAVEKMAKSVLLSPHDKQVTQLAQTLQAEVAKEDAALVKPLSDALLKAGTAKKTR